jgi:hypothetical protein
VFDTKELSYWRLYDGHGGCRMSLGWLEGVLAGAVWGQVEYYSNILSQNSSSLTQALIIMPGDRTVRATRVGLGDDRENEHGRRA